MWLFHKYTYVSNSCHDSEGDLDLLQSSHMWWRSSLHMRHDMESCDQGGEDQDKTWLDGPVASVKGKSEALEWWTAWRWSLSKTWRRWTEATENSKLSQDRWTNMVIWYKVDYIICDWLVHVLHQHWKRWSGMECARQRYNIGHFISPVIGV